MQDIEIIRREIEHMQSQGGARDWDRWQQLKAGLDKEYKDKEEF